MGVYDQLTVFGGNSNPDLTQEICDYIDIPPGRIDVFTFSNENIFVRIGESVRENDVFVIQSLSKPVNESIMELLIMIDTLKRASAGRITAVIPYFGYGRTDKKDQPRVPITARLIADMITVAGANRVLTVDLHAGQLQGFFNIPVDEMTALPTIADYFVGKNLQNPVVVAPDLGSSKRARNFAEDINASLAVIEKRRMGNVDRSEILNLIGSVKDQPAVIIDDEIDTAGSLVQAADVCMKNGASEIYAACSHAVLSGPAIERLEGSPIRELVITNTIPLPPEKAIDKITVLSLAAILGESIQRIHTGTSVSSAYRSADRTPMP
jgi:ribose-phosphate pyrophosphokinase